MGLFDIFKKKPTVKKTLYSGDLIIITGLDKKYKDKEEIKLGKTVLNPEEKAELLSQANELSGKVILYNDLMEFQKTKLKCNPKIHVFPFLSYDERRFDAFYANGVLYQVSLFDKNKPAGIITGEESLKVLNERFEKHISPEHLILLK